MNHPSPKERKIYYENYSTSHIHTLESESRANRQYSYLQNCNPNSPWHKLFSERQFHLRPFTQNCFLGAMYRPSRQLASRLLAYRHSMCIDTASHVPTGRWSASVVAGRLSNESNMSRTSVISVICWASGEVDVILVHIYILHLCTPCLRCWDCPVFDRAVDRQGRESRFEGRTFVKVIFHILLFCILLHIVKTRLRCCGAHLLGVNIRSQLDQYALATRQWCRYLWFVTLTLT